MTDQVKDQAQQEKPEEKKEEVKTEAKEETKVQVSDKLQKIIDQVAELTVLELSDLVKALEDQFGVQAVAAAPVAAAGGAGGDTAAAEEKTEFDVIMAEVGSNKIGVIQALRAIDANLGLKEAKDMTEQLPAQVLTGAKKEDAEGAKAKLEEAGAKVELK